MKSRAIVLAVLFAGLAAQQAAAGGPQATLDPNGFGASTITNGAWSLTTLDPLLVANTALPGGNTSYMSAFNSWNNTLAADKKWTLDYSPNLNAAFTVTMYKPKLTKGGFGDLKAEFTYAPTFVPGAFNPTPIPAGAKMYSSSEAAWSQSVSTNAPLAGKLPGNPYLDGVTYPPAYPFQYPNSDFYDDPGREGTPGGTVTWYGDAMLSQINFATRNVTVYADILWGFTITSTAPPVPPGQAIGTDLGSPLTPWIPVPEPTPVMALGLGVAGVLLRRRRK